MLSSRMRTNARTVISQIALVVMSLSRKENVMAREVIVEYKGQNRTKVIESAAMRRAREYHDARMRRKAKRQKVDSTTTGSTKKESMSRPWYYCGFYTDTKCWKNQKHARKNWMRHLARLDGRSVINKRAKSFWDKYRTPSPSARILADRCIYPNGTS